jgi:hypothetical protein
VPRRRWRSSCTETTSVAFQIGFVMDNRLIPERRKSSRHAATRLPSLRATILAGPDVQVINVSRGGLLVESHVRLTPGAGICLHIHRADQIYSVGGRIVRVDAALVGGQMTYRAGVMLDKDFAMFDLTSEESVVASVLAPPAEEGASSTRQPDIVPGQDPGAARQDKSPPSADPPQPGQALGKLQMAVALGEPYQTRSAENHAAERARRDEERQTLEMRLRQAEQRADQLSGQLAAAIESERRLARRHDEERSKLETALLEMQQQFADLEAHEAAMTAITTQQLEVYEQEREDWAKRNSRLTTQLETTEAWCVDQQDLLYQIRHEMSRVFALLTRVRSRPMREVSKSAAIEVDTD